jgi:pseudaminic acid synthase
MISDILVEGKRIGPGAPPLVIAELSGNHNQSLERALEIVEQAAKAGAHALKLQTYTADTMTLDIQEGDFFIEDAKSLWNKTSLYQLYQKAFTPWEWHVPIFKRCKDLGMLAFSTPFDPTAVDFLESLNVPLYKIASFENTDLPLIRKVSSTGKPVIMSTGMATIAELDESVRAAREAGCRDLILLKCASAYPALPENANLLTIPHLRNLFDCQVGLSDHTLGIGVSIASVALGATVLERHLTLSREDGGVDSAFSLEPQEVAQLVTESTRAWKALGAIHYGPTAEEKPALRFRRSLYVTKDMKAGEQFTDDNLRTIRPGFGLPPKYYSTVLGKRITQAAKRGTPVRWELVG